NLQTDVKDDGNVVVFNTVEKKVVGLLPIPQVAGVVVAPDLHKVYVADSYENIVYVIDEQTLTYRPIPLQANDSPDSIAYDLSDHLVLVSDPGTPPTVDTNIIARKNQNETMIDARTDRVVGRIPLGVDGQWGDDVGFARYDPGLRRAFVVVQQLPDPNSPNPNILPPPGTAWIVEFDPRTRQVITRARLPYGCLTPHGMDLDTAQHIAFIACIDANPPALIRFNLQTLQTIAEPLWPTATRPDMVVFDQRLGVVYVGCGAGISLFQEHAMSFKWLATYTYGISTHTLAVNEQTQERYIPLPREGGRPVLRILHFNLSGT